jgi:protein tyrosine phosphatase (PTP) superfamily phosphohydrolase (DUF442 family)
MDENTLLFILLRGDTIRRRFLAEKEIRAELLRATLRKVSGVALLLLLTAAVAAPQEPAKDAYSIKNFLRVNEQICTGGQPTMAELEKLKQEGVRAIINLRRPIEYNAEEEAAKARELGLRYVNIPVDHSDPKDSQVEDFLRATDDPANRPAFIHSAAANRVGTFWMIRRVLRDHWSLQKAEDEATKIGMRSPNLREFALDYIRRQQKP